MLPELKSISENGVFSSSSSTTSSPIFNPRSQAERNNKQIENRIADIHEIDLLCDESFSQIMKEEEEEEFISDVSLREVVISDAFSTNGIIFALNKRKKLHSDEEEEDGNATKTIYDVNKLRKIHEEEGQKEYNGQNENQESKLHEEKSEDGNQENTNGEEDENEETKEEGEGTTEEMDEDQNERGKI
ncbi:pheromone-processing carboxypeptidase KEX1-like [Solanum stenotomum]|uniref:pheromone-processing carboxypeptidase KEX1-like n=1 Tax=Solanum stenotomum TaxID=172797 RepID=UPI0020D1A939|nr:pheromone-processing carboxypeptidase KEX1-like [Solanum stenotomum]